MRLIPERTIDAWVAWFLSAAVPDISLFAPTSGLDFVAQLPRGQRVALLENKTLTQTYELEIERRQLAMYSIQDWRSIVYYVFPVVAEDSFADYQDSQARASSPNFLYVVDLKSVYETFRPVSGLPPWTTVGPLDLPRRRRALRLPIGAVVDTVLALKPYWAPLRHFACDFSSPDDLVGAWSNVVRGIGPRSDEQAPEFPFDHAYVLAGPYLT